MVKDQFFKIEFYNQKKFEFLGSNNDNYFEELTFFFTSNELSLSVNSKYKIKNCTKNNTLEIKDESDKKYKYMFFNIINKILDEDQPVDDGFVGRIYNRYKDKKFELKNNEIFYKFFKISNLFEDKNLSSVSMFLMIIYNMRAKSVQSLYKLLTKYEQKIFKLLVEFFNGNQIITKDEFIEFILSLKFYNDNLIILNLETNKKYIDKQIEKFKGAEYEEKRENLNILNTKIKKEKDYFKNINYLTQEIEQDKIVDQYDNLIKTIENEMAADKKEKEKLELKEKFENLRKNFQKLIKQSGNEKLENYINSIINKIDLLLKDEFSENDHEIFYKKYEQLKKETKNLVDDNEHNNISFYPYIPQDENLKKSKTSFFLENLIWYSEIKHAIDNIKINNKNNDNKFEPTLTLQKYEEMKFVSNLVISKEELTNDEFNLLYSTLNSYFIMKMIKDDLEEYLFSCTDKINELMENIMIDDFDVFNKNDYFFIREKEKDTNFLIYIPQFKPKDIVLLYIQFGTHIKNDEYKTEIGPILKEIKTKNTLDILTRKIGKILEEDYGQKNAEKTAIELIYILSKEIFGEESIKDFKVFEKDIDNILNQFQKEEPTTKFIKIFRKTLEIARKIDLSNKNQKKKLNFEDMLIFENDKWYEDRNYTTKFPNLIYILNNYKNIYDNIKEFYTKLNEDSDSIPYWLVLLRLLSEKNNIKVDYYIESNELSKIISEKETDYLLIQSLI